MKPVGVLELRLDDPRAVAVDEAPEGFTAVGGGGQKDRGRPGCHRSGSHDRSRRGRRHRRGGHAGG